MRTEYNNYASQALEKAAQDAASCHHSQILFLDEYFMRMVLTMRIF